MHPLLNAMENKQGLSFLRSKLSRKLPGRCSIGQRQPKHCSTGSINALHRTDKEVQTLTLSSSFHTDSTLESATPTITLSVQRTIGATPVWKQPAGGEGRARRDDRGDGDAILRGLFCDFSFRILMLIVAVV
jgi:hypothetical protein